VTQPLLRLENIRRTFRTPSRSVSAVSDVSLEIQPGETVGIVGESGSGKSTIGRIVAGLERADSGRIFWKGKDVSFLPQKAHFAETLGLRMIFQDPYSSLNPRLKAGLQVGEGLRDRKLMNRSQVREKLERLFADVGLLPGHIDRYPHEFSGGQRQRIAIARAMAPEPELIVADEPVSALDLTMQAQIIKVLVHLQLKKRIAYLVISHDISLIARLCDRVAVLHGGRIVEQGPANGVIISAHHPYTRRLIASVPQLYHRREAGSLDPFPSVGDLDADPLLEVAPEHFVRSWC
jgi:oligopeptide transport system ATP-binding protein